jgi:tetratricopeptide (TPR) repeat protein
VRFATDPARIYTAGFSGGAHLAWALGQPAGALAGVIATGGRFIPELLPERPTYASFATAGDTDFNFQGTRRVDRALAARGAPHRLEIFQGPHQWMPRELAGLAVQWMELQAMRRGLRERDGQLVGTAYRAELESARALEACGQVLAAGRRYQAIAQGFAGLADVSEPEAAATRLVALPAFAAAVEEERRWDAFESGHDVRLGQAVGDLKSLDPPMPARRLLVALDVAGLQRQAAEDGVAGVTARRILNRVFTQTAHYLPQELLAQQQIPQAISALEVAVTIRPEDATVWYNLACARSRGGQVKAALEALGEALDHGFRDVALLESDPDLAAVRKREAYQTLLVRLRSSP